LVDANEFSIDAAAINDNGTEKLAVLRELEVMDAETKAERKHTAAINEVAGEDLKALDMEEVKAKEEKVKEAKVQAKKDKEQKDEDELDELEAKLELSLLQVDSESDSESDADKKNHGHGKPVKSSHALTPREEESRREKKPRLQTLHAIENSQETSLDQKAALLMAELGMQFEDFEQDFNVSLDDLESDFMNRSSRLSEKEEAAMATQLQLLSDKAGEQELHERLQAAVNHLSEGAVMLQEQVMSVRKFLTRVGNHAVDENVEAKALAKAHHEDSMDLKGKAFKAHATKHHADVMHEKQKAENAFKTHAKKHHAEVMAKKSHKANDKARHHSKPHQSTKHKAELLKNEVEANPQAANQIPIITFAGEKEELKEKAPPTRAQAAVAEALAMKKHATKHTKHHKTA